PAPPYEKDLLRLSEIVGSLAFLRSLCASSDAAEWPKRMQALLESEGTTPGRRERLAGAYNRGYRGYALTYRVCTPSATEAMARYLKEGEALSRNLAGRYGG
ncbi:MAG TPA: TIGR02301 family protein, partial [Beijerinckiaceae bacterium]|nr:TIGR02301 family protein [Beijerinckiaceae bacterium]